jgi:methylmalonyl-CoA mutase N-terminal domain/subunit
VIAHESGVTNTIDPLGGSYFVEALTDDMERQAYEYFAKIDELGGMVEAVKRGFPQREIADAAFRYQQEVERGERIVVGVNAFEQEDDGGVELLRIDPALEQKQVDRLQGHRARRDATAVETSLGALREGAAVDGRNLMPALLDCARAGASEGEIVEALQTVFGTYTEAPVF